MAAEVRPSAAAQLTLLPKEMPLAAEMKAWVEDNLTRLPPDQRALVMGVEPQGVVAFEPATVLPPLVYDAATGITMPMVAARDAAIQAIVDSNTIGDEGCAFCSEFALHYMGLLSTSSTGCSLEIHTSYFIHPAPGRGLSHL